MYSKHTCATRLLLKTPLNQKILSSLESSKFLSKSLTYWWPNGLWEGSSATPCADMGRDQPLVPSPTALHLPALGWQGPFPALFSPHLLCLSGIIILLKETVLDYWGTSKPLWQAYKHGMIYSPAFGLYHSVCWEMSLQESSISVYYLWAKTCLPQRSACKLMPPSRSSLTALWCPPSKKQPLLIQPISWEQSPGQNPLL